MKPENPVIQELRDRIADLEAAVCKQGRALFYDPSKGFPLYTDPYELQIHVDGNLVHYETWDGFHGGRAKPVRVTVRNCRTGQTFKAPDVRNEGS